MSRFGLFACASLSWGALSSAALLGCQSTSAPDGKSEVAVSKEENVAKEAAPAADERSATVAASPAPSTEVAAKDAPVTPALNMPAAAKSVGEAPKAPEVVPVPASPSADAPAAPKAETKQGAVISEEPFSAWLEAASPLAAGSPASVDVVLVAKAPYHTNAEYPHKFKLNAAPPGLSYPEAVVKGMQVKPERSVLRVPVQAQQPGPATVSGSLSFSVCTEERCLVEKRDLSLALEVK